MRKDDGTIIYVHVDYVEERQRELGYKPVNYDEDKFTVVDRNIVYDGKELNVHDHKDKEAIESFQDMIDRKTGEALKALIEGDSSLVEEFKKSYSTARSVINNMTTENLKKSYGDDLKSLDSSIEAGHFKVPGYQTQREREDAIKKDINDLLIQYHKGDKSLSDEIRSKIRELSKSDGGWYSDDLDMLAEAASRGNSTFGVKGNSGINPGYSFSGGVSPGNVEKESPSSNVKESFDAAAELERLLSQIVGYSQEFVGKYEIYSPDGNLFEKDRELSMEVLGSMQDELDELYDTLDKSILDEEKYARTEAKIKSLADDLAHYQERQGDLDFNFIIEGMVDLAKQREVVARETKAELLYILKNEELTEDMQNTYREEINRLEEMINSSLNERKNLANQIFEYEQNIHYRRIDNIRHEQSLLENELALLEAYSPDDIGKHSKILAKITKQQSNITASLIRQKEELIDQQREFEVGSYEWNLRLEKIKELNLEIGQSKIESANLHKQLESNADKIIDIIKRSYEKQRDIALAEFDKLMKELDERYQKHIDKIDDAEDERDYTRALAKEQEKQAEIRRKINILMLDDSHEAQSQRIDLEKEYDEITESIEEMQHKRSLEVRKDTLRKEYEMEKEALQKKRDAEEYNFNEILNNERRFAELRKDIVEGNVEDLKEKLGGFLFDFQQINDKVAWELRESFQGVLNMIDELNEAMSGLEGIEESTNIYNPNPNSSNSSNNSNNTQSTGNPKNIRDGMYNTATKHFITEEDMEKLPADIVKAWMTDRNVVSVKDGYAYKLHQLVGKSDEEARALGLSVKEYERQHGILFDDISEKMGDVTHLEVMVNGKKNTLTVETFWDMRAADIVQPEDIMSFIAQDGKIRDIDEYFDMKAAGFDTGGYTGSWGNSGKLAILHEKELVLNKSDTSNLLESLKILQGGINIPKLLRPSTENVSNNPVYNLNLNIDNLNGTQKDADDLSTRIMDNLRKMGR